MSEPFSLAKPLGACPIIAGVNPVTRVRTGPRRAKPQTSRLHPSGPNPAAILADADHSQSATGSVHNVVKNVEVNLNSLVGLSPLQKEEDDSPEEINEEEQTEQPSQVA